MFHIAQNSENSVANLSMDDLVLFTSSGKPMIQGHDSAWQSLWKEGMDYDDPAVFVCRASPSLLDDEASNYHLKFGDVSGLHKWLHAMCAGHHEYNMYKRYKG